MTQIFDFGDSKKHEQLLYKTWAEFRNSLSVGEFEYDDIDAALEKTFLKVFDDMFEKNNQKKIFSRKLGDIAISGLYLARGGILKPDEKVSYDRFIPNCKYIKEDNRFSPPGVEWLYLAMGDDYSDVKECTEAECRVKKGERFGVCKFKIDTLYYDRRIVDLTISNDVEYDDINNSLEEFGQNVVRESVNRALHGKSIKLNEATIKTNIATWATYLYAKILSRSIFEPVNSMDKRRMYSPFQCMAKYFEKISFDGIIYGSTVFDKAKNIVLFDKKFATPVDDIDIMTV